MKYKDEIKITMITIVVSIAMQIIHSFVINKDHAFFIGFFTCCIVDGIWKEIDYYDLKKRMEKD